MLETLSPPVRKCVEVLREIQAGVVETLDALLKELLAAAKDERKEILTKIEDEVSKLTEPAARYDKVYVKAAKSILMKGTDYAKNEIERLQRILGK